MGWRFPWSDSIKKRACRYLLQRYLGQFLKEKLTLEQLSVDIYEGTGEIKDILLDVDALNDVGAANNLPVEFVDGCIRQVRVSIPWSALLTTSSSVEISGLQLTVQAKQMLDDAAMFDSMLDSMSTSTMDMAKECLSQVDPRGADSAGAASETLDGIEALATAIDTVLLRIKVRFVDTVVRVEHVGQERGRGVGVELKIACMDYMDEAGRELSSQPSTSPLAPAALSVKRLSLDGVSLHSVEFPADCRAQPGGMAASFSEHAEDDEEDGGGTPQQPGSEPILLGQFNGRTELRCEVKVADAAPGPKLSIQVSSGAFCVMLGPRQLHDLVELLSGIVDPQQVEKSAPRPSGAGRQGEKPMTPSDYQVIEDQLLRKNLAARDLLTTQALRAQGWSSSHLEDEDEEFLPFIRPAEPPLSASVTSVATSADMDTSMTSSVTGSCHSDAASAAHRSELSYTRSRPRRRRDRAKDDEQSEDSIRLRLQLGTVCVVLLHDDVLATSPDSQMLTTASLKQMQRLVESGLARLSSVSVAGDGARGTRAALLEACPYSHLSLVAAPTKLECSERPSGGSRSVFSLTLTAGAAELLECLVERRTSVSAPNALYTELLTFETGEPPPAGRSEETASPTEGALTLSVRHSQPLVNRHAASSVVTVSLRLAACRTEVDISLTDRLAALLNPAPRGPAHRVTTPPSAEHADVTKQQCFNAAMDDRSAGGESRVDLHISAPLVDVQLRIPVPDLRPLSDMERPPWWRRRVRPDSLRLKLTDAAARSSLRSRDERTRLELQARHVTVAYQETETAEPVVFINVSASGGDCAPSGGSVGLDWPRAELTLYPARTAPLLEAESAATGGGRDSSPAADSSSSSPFAGLSAAAAEREPSPFGRRRVVYETDAHWRGEPDTASEGEELVIPASREEVDQFVEATIANCQTLLDLSLPVVEAVLPSKRFYELIYNRLATDLALWEPAAPSLNGGETAQRPADPLVLLTDGYQMCKSATAYDSDTDSDAEASVYESVYEQRQRQRRRQRHQDEAIRSRQSRFCLRLQLGQGIAALQTPCLTEEEKPVPGHHGEVQLAVDSGSLFVTSGFGGLYGHGFICLSAHRASLYHKGQMPTPSSPVLPGLDSIPRCLDRLVSHYEPETTAAGAGRSTADMVSVAVQYRLDETNNIKTFTVAVGLDGCALRPRMLPSLQQFVAQVMDMFDVVDFPVAGYDMPGTVTQLHLLITSSALDLRPLSLPYQYLLTVDSFMLSSHLAAATGTAVLRFILEEAALHVADRSGAALADMLSQYVCVLEAGLLELSVRKSDAVVGGQPLFDFRCSNNTIQARTCADSLRALVQLVTYLAAGEGDTAEQPPPPPPPPPPTPRVQQRSEDGAEAGLADLMEEAMQESSPPRPATAPASQGPVEVFFFPNEPHVSSPSSPPPPPPPQAATDEPPGSVMATMAEALADIEDEFEDVDESFCVLDDDPGSGIRSRSGEPQVRVLTSEPIRVVDDFLPRPLSRADVLRPPAHFAAPLRRYTLQQMSLSWGLYGGHDLPSTTAARQARKVRIESPPATPPGSPRARLGQRTAGSPIEVAFSKHGAQKVRFGTLTPPDGAVPPPSPAAAARLRGGPGRLPGTMMELRLNKVRCQAEEYPEHTEEARRFVLAVQDVEVLDRIATSDINKFLYQYSSESCPRQAHSNMVLLKALSRRPDPAVATEECDVRMALCPIRLNVDQDALFFLRDFFREAAGDVAGSGSSSGGGPVSPVSDAPVLSITQQDARFELDEDTGEDDGEEEEDGGDEDRLPPQAARSSSDVQKTFFRTFTFSPEVLIRIDYQGKRVDIGQFGPVIGLIIGLGQLNCSEIRLKRISHKSGLLGLDRLVQHALNEWLTDIRRNQLPSVLGGIGPMHSFVQLFQGIRDLVWMPIEQYQKDGRIYKGLQRGANSFTTSTAMAFLELTNRLVGYVQGASEFTYDMLSPGPSMRQKRRQKRSRRRTSNLPQDLREGVTNAYELVKEGLGETAQTLARVAAEEHDQKGVSGAVGGVLRQIPPTMVKPILLASEATSNVLDGMRNQLAPDARREALDKWKATE